MVADAEFEESTGFFVNAGPAYTPIEFYGELPPLLYTTHIHHIAGDPGTYRTYQVVGQEQFHREVRRPEVQFPNTDCALCAYCGSPMQRCRLCNEWSCEVCDDYGTCACN